MMKSKQFHFPREVLLIEIDRRCADPDCGRKNLIGLTKPEAIQYRGFDCLHCGRWNDDQLSDSELPVTWFRDETELVN